MSRESILVGKPCRELEKERGEILAWSWVKGVLLLQINSVSLIISCFSSPEGAGRPLFFNKHSFGADTKILL